MVATMSQSAIRTRRWTRREYDRLIQLGILGEDEKIELLAGRMIVAEPQNTPHAKAIELAADALRAAFGPGWRIRVQLPIALDRRSEPEPDLAVIAGSPRDDRDDHPSRPVLVLEIADSSLRLDRGLKARRYARAGVRDYWILNLRDRVLEIRRAPGREQGRWDYRSLDVLGPDAGASPLAAPAASIRVADLLP
jgi:Uma2 family endonuclease